MTTDSADLAAVMAPTATEAERVRANIPLPEVLQEDDTFLQALPQEYQLVEELIQAYPRDLGHLEGIPIKILFRRKRCSFVYKTSAFSKRDALIHAYRFLIQIDQLWWKSNEDRRRPMLFEALYSCDINGETGATSVKKFEVQTFLPVIQHFGPWQQSLKDMSAQLELFETKPGGAS